MCLLVQILRQTNSPLPARSNNRARVKEAVMSLRGGHFRPSAGRRATFLLLRSHHHFCARRPRAGTSALGQERIVQETGSEQLNGNELVSDIIRTGIFLCKEIFSIYKKILILNPECFLLFHFLVLSLLFYTKKSESMKYCIYCI